MAIQKSHGNCKPKIYNRYAHKKRKTYPSITLNIVIKSQENKTRKGGKDLQKQIQNKNMAVRLYIDNYFKYKQTKYSNQKTQTD